MNKPVKPEAKRFLQFQTVVENSKNSLTRLTTIFERVVYWWFCGNIMVTFGGSVGTNPPGIGLMQLTKEHLFGNNIRTHNGTFS